MTTANQFFAFLFSASALFFFACGTDLDDDILSSSSTTEQSLSSGGSSSSSDGTVIIEVNNKQVYDGFHLSECDSPESCDLNKLYTGSGVLKEIVRNYIDGYWEDAEIIDTVEVGTVNNGKINLQFYTPKEEYLDEGGAHLLVELRLYNNANEPFGRLALIDGFNRDYNTVAHYLYLSEDYYKKDTYSLTNQNVKFVTDYDFKKGWNLYYENDSYDYINGEKWLTVTKTSHAEILNGAELRWYLGPIDRH
jgi:hypothetical protein